MNLLLPRIYIILTALYFNKMKANLKDIWKSFYH